MKVTTRYYIGDILVEPGLKVRTTISAQHENYTFEGEIIKYHNGDFIIKHNEVNTTNFFLPITDCSIDNIEVIENTKNYKNKTPDFSSVVKNVSQYELKELSDGNFLIIKKTKTTKNR